MAKRIKTITDLDSQYARIRNNSPGSLRGAQLMTSASKAWGGARDKLLRSAILAAEKGNFKKASSIAGKGFAQLSSAKSYKAFKSEMQGKKGYDYQMKRLGIKASGLGLSAG